MDSIQEERRHKFAFKGIRWYDLLRWRIVDQQIATYKTDVPVYKFGVLEKKPSAIDPKRKDYSRYPKVRST